VVAPSFIEAARLVEQAIARDGRTPGEVTFVVLLGSRGGELLAALPERAPNAMKLLLLEPEAQAAALARALQAKDPRFAQLVVFGPEELQPAQEFLGAYLTVLQFLLGSRLPPGQATCIVDPVTADTAVGRALASALDDLTRGLSREFLRLVAGKPEFASVLNAVAQFLAAHGDHYTALKLYSSVAPQKMNAALVHGAFACLVALGNAELCEHWLRAMPLDEPSRAGLRQQIPEACRARRPQQEALLERNLSFLAEHFPAAAATLRQAEPAPDLFAIELPDQPWRVRSFGHEWSTERSSYQLLVRARGLAFSEENPLTELREMNDALVACAVQGQDHVWLGGWVKHAMFAINAIAQPSLLTLHGWRRVTFLQEEDSGALLRWLSVVDLQPWFDSAQVRLTVGPNATEELVRVLVENLHQAVPELGIGVTAEARRQVLQQRLRRLARAPELFAALERRYQLHPQRLHALLREQHRPLKIALMTSRYTTVLQHVTRDLAEGFEQLGHQTFVLLEERPGEALIAFGVAERLLELEPDLMVVIDHVRPEYAALLPPGMPVVSWVLDELPSLKDPSTIAKLGSLDLTYGFNSAIERGFRALGYPNMGQLPFAVNPARYFPEPPLASATGVAFTTHIGQFSQDPPGAPGLNALLARAFDEAPEIPLEMFRILPLLEAALSELGLSASEEAKRHLLYHGLQLARQQDRERVAQRIVAAGLPLTVYGLGWDSMPEFAGKSGGVVAAGPQLRQVYRQHRTVLHINRGCNVHPRVLETLCSGGLVIARWDPLDDEPGETADQLGDVLPLFRSHAEMLALLRRAESDDAFRNQLVLRGQARVLEQHTYQARARKVLVDLAQLIDNHVRAAAADGAASASEAKQSKAPMPELAPPKPRATRPPRAPAPLRPEAASLQFPALESESARACLQQLLSQRWSVSPEQLARVCELSAKVQAASETGRALLFVAVHRENFPTLGYLVHGLREQGVRAFGAYLMAEIDESKPEPFDDCISCRGSLGVLSELLLRVPDVTVYLQAHATRAFLSQLLHALRPELRIFQEVYDWMDAFVPVEHEALFEQERVFTRSEIEVMRASERYVRTRTSGFIYKDGGEPLAQLLAESTVPSVQLMPCPPKSFQLAPAPPPAGPPRLAHAGGLRSAGASRAFGDIYTIPLYRELLAQGLDVTVFPSAVSPQGFDAAFGDYRRLAEEHARAHFREHLGLRELIGALHGAFHYGMLLYHFNADLIVGERHLRGALASKLFVYWAAGLPALVSEELQYMATLVRDTGAGLVVKRSELATLAQRLASVDYRALQARVAAAQERYHIERFLPQVTQLLTDRPLPSSSLP